VGPCLRDSCNTTDLSNLFVPGSIPSGIATPEPSELSALVFGPDYVSFGQVHFAQQTRLGQQNVQFHLVA
jgi:hypothetical protein